MITIFTIPKPFKGHIKVIQTNAIRSWLKLHPRCQVILFGDEEGIAETAEELGVQQVPDVKRNEFGTPLLDYIFRAAHNLAKHNILCYVNADIILMSDFMKGVQIVKKRMRKFLIVGRRWNVDISELIYFRDPDWEGKLKNFVMKYGKLFIPTAIDYFVFTRGLFREIPSFAVGRAGWDNWMIYKALISFIPVVDLTNFSMIIHQNHDYSHHPMGREGVFRGIEAEQNKMLAGGHFWGVECATHIFEGSRLTLDISYNRLKGHLCRLLFLFPLTSPLVRRYLENA